MMIIFNANLKIDAVRVVRFYDFEQIEEVLNLIFPNNR